MLAEQSSLNRGADHTMIIEAESSDFHALIAGAAPRRFHLPDSEIAPRDVLLMLHDLAEEVRPDFRPAAWLIVEDSEVVGLCSVIRDPGPTGTVEIGYGVAPTRRRRGIAGRAVADILNWAKSHAQVHALAAETALSNQYSQRALEMNGFQKWGERVDEEDGQLICWKVETRS